MRLRKASLTEPGTRRGCSVHFRGLVVDLVGVGLRLLMAGCTWSAAQGSDRTKNTPSSATSNRGPRWTTRLPPMSAIVHLLLLKPSPEDCPRVPNDGPIRRQLSKLHPSTEAVRKAVVYSRKPTNESGIEGDKLHSGNMDQLRANKLEESDREAEAIALIRHFLDAAALAGKSDGPEEKSLVARLCAESITAFRAIVKHLLERQEATSESRKAYTSLQRSLSRLILWSDGYGVAAGKLDEVFTKSQDVRRATLSILASIGRTLVESTLTP